MNRFGAGFGARGGFCGADRRVDAFETQHGAQAGTVVVEDELGIVHACDGSDEAEPESCAGRIPARFKAHETIGHAAALLTLGSASKYLIEHTLGGIER